MNVMTWVDRTVEVKVTVAEVVNALVVLIVDGLLVSIVALIVIIATVVDNDEGMDAVLAIDIVDRLVLAAKDELNVDTVDDSSEKVCETTSM